MLLAEARSKLQDNIVVSADGGTEVDGLLQNIQVADVVNNLPGIVDITNILWQFTVIKC